MLFLFLVLVVSAKVFVFSPDDLRNEFQSQETEIGEIPASLANFGNPPYGSKLLGRVFYFEAESQACAPLPPLDFSQDIDSRNSAILMIDRGGCFFVVKIRNAQNIGAQAVIVVDNVDEDVGSLIMTDNGNGGNLNIPSFMISKKDGEKIKKYLRDPATQAHVALDLHFELTKSPSSVSMVLWMSAGDAKIMAFLHDFDAFADHFTKTELDFSPHYATIVCWGCAIDNFIEDRPDCISGGRYCALDPDGFGPITGRDVLMENLREICIFQKTIEKDNYSLWFDYMSAFNNTCLTVYSRDCSESIMSPLGILPDDIQACIQNSIIGDNIKINDNSLLQGEQMLSYQFPLIFTPSIFLNTQLYRGDIEAEEVALAVCNSYQNPPDACKEPKHQADIRPKGSGIKFSTVVVLIAVIIVLVTGILILYRIWLKREMQTELQQQVNLAVAQYHALSSDGSQMAERPKVRTVVKKAEK
jgi:hypothetical protein